MSRNPGGQTQTLSNHGRRSWFPHTVLALGAAALLLFATTEWIHGRFVIGEQQVLALNRIQMRIAISHLWVEEYVSGDNVDLDEIRGNLEESERLLDGIQEQSADSIRLLDSGEQEISREIVLHAQSALDRFGNISRRRVDGVENAEDVGIGSTIDAQFDAVFAAVLTDLRTLEKVYQTALDRNEARSRLLVRAIAVAWVLIVGLAVGGLWHWDQRRAKAESELVESESQLLQSQKMDAVGRLAGGIAHDINNHLAAITMQCELVKLRAAEGDAIIARMDSIAAIGAKSADLIKRLLAFSRKQPVQPEVCSLERIVTGMEKMLVRLIGEDIQLQVRCGDGLWKVLMDPSQLEQILLNLIINSRDAMPAGGKISVSIENRTLGRSPDSWDTSSPGDYIVLTVADQGTGIPAAIMDKIYEPYFTTKDVSMSSGLGLATIYGIVTQNGGHITLDSEEGRGTTFEIHFPRCDSSENEETRQAVVQTRPANGSTAVLLVEDNEELCEGTCEILREFGYKVSSASDGEQALQVFDEIGATISLVITDVVMPGIGGKELAAQLRDRQPQLPIIFISGYTDDVMLRHGVAEGEVDFLSKPFSAGDLVKTVQEVLGREKNAQAADRLLAI